MKLQNWCRLGAAVVVVTLPSVVFAQGNSQNAPGKAEVIPAAYHDHSFVLRDAPGKPDRKSVV